MPTSKKAAKKTTAKVSVPRTLNVASGPSAKLPTIIKNIETALGKVGCRGCRSGIDKIVIGDLVQKGIR